MKRLILCSILGASLLFADTRPMLDDGAPVAAGSRAVTIYVTQKGKIYHTHRDCSGLSRSTVLQSTEYDAQVHGLTLCKICAHRHHAASIDGKNGSWAKAESPKQEK